MLTTSFIQESYVCACFILLSLCLHVYESFLVQVNSDTNFTDFLFTPFTITYGDEVHSPFKIHNNGDENKSYRYFKN